MTRTLSFLFCLGEEVTSNLGKIYVHLNALNPKRPITARRGDGPRETLQNDLQGISQADGLAQINHPNFFWQLTAAHISASKGVKLLEIMNMHPLVNSFGAGPGFPGARLRLQYQRNQDHSAAVRKIWNQSIEFDL
jgi:hypothetical protein